MKFEKWLRPLSIVASLLIAQAGEAKCGGVDYSWGSDALALMHDFVATMMMYVLYIVYAVGGIVVLYAAMQIYLKMMSGEPGILKDFLMVLGACLFLVGASIVFPAFFGYQI